MKNLTLTALLLLSSQLTHACTVCGCSASNQYLGVQPQFFKHFVGLQYQYREFTSEHPGHGENDASSYSTEQYNTYQLWGRLNAGKRLRLFAFVPYVSNIQSDNGNKTNLQGLGDITVLANYRLLKLEQQNNKWQHDLQAGGGIKLPTGTYDGKKVSTGEGLPNMQPGTQSWDFIANVNYTARRGSTGGNLDASYTVVTPNANNYKFGNRLSTGITGFYWWQKNDFTLMPQAGVRFDLAERDYDDYSARTDNDMSGGEQVYISAGMQAYYRYAGLQLMFYRPIYQYYAGGLVINKYRAETGIYFLF